MFDETKKYKNNGHFFFQKGNKFIEVSKDVPELPGVYYIIRLANNRVDLVYIGKMVGAYGIRIHDEKGEFNSPQQFFDKKMIEENIDGLDIYWFVTMDKTNDDLPGYVEGLLMQRHFDLHGKLPPWNNEFY